MKVTKKNIIFLFFAFILSIPLQSKIWHVTKTGAGNKSGSSWLNATDDLQDIINKSTSGDEIHIARGTYAARRSALDPTGPILSTIDPNIENCAFVPKSGVKMIGGFRGVYDSDNLAVQTYVDYHETDLSGGSNYGTLYIASDQQKADYYFEAINFMGPIDVKTDLQHGAVYATLAGEDSKLTIKRCRINGGGDVQSEGGGIYIAASNKAKVYFETNFFEGNSSLKKGGGVYAHMSGGSLLEMHNNRFDSNFSGQEGGAIYVQNDNTDNTPVIIQGNTIQNTYQYYPENLDFFKNYYEGIYLSGTGKFGIYNTIISKYRNGKGYDLNKSPQALLVEVKNNLIGSTPFASELDNTNLIGIDPKFDDDTNYLFENGHWLSKDSPCIDKGDNQYIPERIKTDMAFNERIRRTSPADVGRVDIGAYEFPLSIAHTGKILYVKKGATGTGDGSSWTNAIPELSDAIVEANRLRMVKTPPKAIHVAQGTYYPLYLVGDGVGRQRAFDLPVGIEMVGGFAGISESEKSDPSKYKSILSGNIGDLSTDADNSYFVVIGFSEEPDGLHLDGFTIQDGNANEEEVNYGDNHYYKNIERLYSGLANVRLEVKGYSSLVFKNNTVTNNKAGGINHGTYSNCIYMSNTHQSLLAFENNTIVNNQTYNNQDVYGSCIIRVVSCNGAQISNNLFAYNTSGFRGNSGTQFAFALNGVHPDKGFVANNTFADNIVAGATTSSLVYFNTEHAESKSVFGNNIIYRNFGISQNDLSVSQKNAPKVKNNLIEHYTGSVALDGSNILYADPRFVDSANKDYRLQLCSPAIDSGNDDYVASTITKDLDGNARKVRIVDMGAYEYQGNVDTPETLIRGLKLNGISATESNSTIEVSVEYGQKPWKLEITLAEPTKATAVVYKDGGATLIPDLNNIDLQMGVNTFRIEVASIVGASCRKTYTLKATMTKKPLTIAGMTIKNKEVDGTNVAEINNQGALQGIINSDVVTVDYSAAVATFSATSVGANLPVNVSGLTLTGANASNYTLTMPAGLKANIYAADAEFIGIKVDNVLHPIDQIYSIECDGRNQISVEVLTKTGATVSSSEVSIVNKMFDLATPNPMYKEVNFTITALGGESKAYKLMIEKRFAFDDIIFTQWNNTFLLNLKALSLGGYSPNAYQWYRDNEAISNASKSYYSAGAKRNDLLTSGAKYHVGLTMQDGNIIRSCQKVFVKRTMSVRAYPNPAVPNEAIWVDADMDSELLEGGHIEVYSLMGIAVSKTKVESRLTEIPNPKASGTYIVKFVGKDGFSETLKVIVK